MQEYGFFVCRYLSIITLSAFLAGVLVSPTCASDQLDRIDFGNRSSESSHNLKAVGSEVMGEHLVQDIDPRLTGISASSAEVGKGYLPALAIDGEKDTRWNVRGPDRQWLMFTLNRAVEVSSLSFLKKEGSRRFRFEIQVRQNQGRWKTVHSGRAEANGTFETYDFDPVKADQIRLVCFDKDWMNVQEIRIDALDFPDAYDTAAHHDALGESGRRLKPGSRLGKKGPDENWMHGWMEFDVRVDPEKKNYLTVKLWGSETSMGTLGMMMAHGNKNEPYRWITSGRHFTQHYPYRYLWRGNGWATITPPYPNRWMYRTYALPPTVTDGKQSVRLRIQNMDSRGRSRGAFSPTLYSLYTHTNAHFTPPNNEPQGVPFEWGKIRGKPDPDQLESKLKSKAKNFIENIVENKKRGNLDILSQIYHTEWSRYHRDPRLIRWAAKTLDKKADWYEINGGPESRWAGLGRSMARPYTKLHDAFERIGLLDESIEIGDDNEKISRRKAYARMFKREFDIFHKRRRKFTNQTFYSSVGVYYLNRAVQQLAPDQALPEEKARWFVYEVFGMVPFGPDMGGWHKEAMDAGMPERVMTEKGLTRELGYATGYGEMSDQFAELARDIGSPSLKERVAQTVKARTHFRVPDQTENGYRTLRGIGLFGHRGRKYPAGQVYGHYDALTEAAILQDPVSVRLAELYLEHHGTFTGGHHSTPIETYENYLTFQDLPASDYRLPVEPNQNNQGWADEENGVFMVRNGDDYIYGGLYIGPAPFAVNPIGYVYHRTPLNDRLVSIHLETRSPDSGKTHTIGPKEDNWRPLKMPDGHRSVLRGQELPITPLPPVMNREWPPREYRKGRAWFYRAEYGPYLIGMNTTDKKSFNASLYELNVPEEWKGKQAVDLISGRSVDLSTPVVVPPKTTLILQVERQEDDK